MKQADGGTRGPIRLCAPACAGGAGERRRGGITRRHRAIPRGGRLLSFHTFRSMRDRRLFYIHSRWMNEAAFQTHAELPHTVRFLERVDALLDQPRDVARTEMIG